MMKRMAEAAHQTQLAYGDHDPNEPMPREALAGIGKEVLRHIGQQECDEDILDAVHDKLPGMLPMQQVALFTMLHKPCDQLTLIASYRWANSGFPQVAMGHKYAAALMATCVTEELKSHIIVPWPAFVIMLPPGLVHIINDETKRASDVRHVLVAQLRFRGNPQPGWAMIVFTDSSELLWRYGPSVDCLLDMEKDTAGWTECDFIHPFEDVDKRAAALLGRLVCGVCLAMSDPDNIKGPKHSGQSAKVVNDPRQAPNLRTYQLGKPINLDCRPAIRSYLEGKRKGGVPEVQVLVRGHWKMQPWGPKHSLRKAIQVQPYWRGNEEAPINVRDHVLGKEPT